MSVSPTNTPAPTSTTPPPSDSKTNAVNLSSHYIPVTVSVKPSHTIQQLHVHPHRFVKTKSQQEPKCAPECSVAKRNRKLAEALGINVTLGNSGGGSGFGNVVYNGELVAFRRAVHDKFLGGLNKASAE
ncbi:hypothetical protein D9758_015840 [Tetrapyrgos nigripes]|uniref:Uncharacterized protein n=1 Tax=Tetrapyrgos nigripes TaxID=182062 RepID=A0A8H5C8D0_9AGAR|nr:hypothetical protein D9758_015840 [Tetrapyrgos nigripes]